VRSYGKINEDMPMIAAALEEAGYPVAQFGTIVYTEKDGLEKPERRFVNFGRRRYDKSFAKTHECAGDEWVVGHARRF
jgi:hypothetical protein